MILYMWKFSKDLIRVWCLEVDQEDMNYVDDYELWIVGSCLD